MPSKQIKKPDNTNGQHHVGHEAEEEFCFGVAVDIGQVKCWKDGVVETNLISKKVGG
jgi:hypothetical protein